MPITKRATSAQRMVSGMRTELSVISILARVASVTAVLMYVFYFPQIIGNLNGHKGDWIQPLVAAVNCTLWVLYGLWRPKKDVPIIIANAPGILFGGLAAITALIECF